MELVQQVDKTNATVGGAPNRNLYLQHQYNLSDPEQNQVNDRLVFSDLQV